MPRLYQTSPRLTFVVLAAAAAAFSLMQSLVTPVLPIIQHDLHTGPGTVTWVLTAWLLSASVATPLMGRVGDMIGKDRTLLVALGAIAAGCLIAALAAHRVVPASPVRTPGRINWVAALLLSGWLVALLLPLSNATTWGWTSARTLGLLVGAVLLAAGWLAVELRSANPLIDMRMMRLPAVWTTNLVAMLFGAGMFAVYAFVPRFVQTPRAAGYGFGADVTTSGLLMLPMLVTMATAGSLSGPIAGRVSSKAQLILGSALSAVSCAMYAWWHGSEWPIGAASAIFGLGLGLVFASMINLIVQSVPPAQTGVASGMNANIRTIGASIGTAVVSSIVTAHIGPAGYPAESGYTTSFLLLAVVGLAATALAVLVPAARAARRTMVAPELTPVEV
jgi:predicted MFS family arabinose efflux permease